MIWRMFEAQIILLAASRTFWMAGSSSAMSSADDGDDDEQFDEREAQPPRVRGRRPGQVESASRPPKKVQVRPVGQRVSQKRRAANVVSCSDAWDTSMTRLAQCQASTWFVPCSTGSKWAIKRQSVRFRPAREFRAKRCLRRPGRERFQ